MYTLKFRSVNRRVDLLNEIRCLQTEIKISVTKNIRWTMNFNVDERGINVVFVL